jgi:hypothetical protein
MPTKSSVAYAQQGHNEWEISHLKLDDHILEINKRSTVHWSRYTLLAAMQLCDTREDIWITF